MHPLAVHQVVSCCVSRRDAYRTDKLISCLPTIWSVGPIWVRGCASTGVNTPGTVFPESSPDECFQYEEYPIDAQGDADRISPVLSAIVRGVPKQQEFPRLLSHGEMCGVLEPHELLGWGFHVCEPLGCNLGVDINIVAASKDNQTGKPVS